MCNGNYRFYCSAPVRHNFRSRHDDNSTDDERHGEVPRHAEQRAGVHETSRSPESSVRTRNGLRRVHMGDDKRIRPGQGRTPELLDQILLLKLQPAKKQIGNNNGKAGIDFVVISGLFRYRVPKQ